MDLTIPSCNHPDCVVSLVSRNCMGRRGDRTVSYEGQGWRCARCADPETGQIPLEFVDSQLLKSNEVAMAMAWRAKFGEDVPPSGRPDRKSDNPHT